MSNNKPKLKDILFLDIETTSVTANYAQLSPTMQKLWDRKAAYWSEEKSALQPAEWYDQKAALLAEFGQIVAIGVAYFYEDEYGQWCLRSKAITGKDEAHILQQFIMLLGQKRFDVRRTLLCAHNGREFDFPFLCRRMAVHQMPIPELLYSPLRKPWEMPLLDTMEMWRFGDRRSYVPLALLAELLGVPQMPEDTLEHDKVSAFYYQNPEENLPKIADLARHDVVLVAQVYLALTGLPAVHPDNIFYVD